MERVLENAPRHFRRQVWVFTNAAGRGVEQIVGAQRFLPLPDGRTRFEWDYDIVPTGPMAGFFAARRADAIEAFLEGGLSRFAALADGTEWPWRKTRFAAGTGSAMEGAVTDAALAPRRLDLVALVLGVGFALMWASAFTSARIIVETAPPASILALRFAISGVLALALAAALGERMRLTAPQWRATALFGIFQNCLYLGFNFAAMRTVEASLAAIVASTMPLLVAAALWIGGERLPRAGAAGLALGFAGAALVMGTRLSAGVDPAGFALCLAGVLALTFATLALRGAISGGNPMFVVGVQMLVAAVLLGAAGALSEEWDVAWTPRLGAAFAYTLLIPGLAATYVWFRLVARIGPTRAATFHFLTPPFGVLIAWALLGEALGWTDVLGAAVVAAGILMVQRARAA